MSIDRKILSFVFLFVVAVFWLLADLAFETVWKLAELPDWRVWVLTFPELLVSFFSVGLLVFLRKSVSVNQFGVETVSELRQVVWPSRSEVFRVSVSVLFLVFFVALILFFFDRLSAFLIGKILGF